MRKNLILTGMMGVGKSTIGKNLAKKLSCDFRDIDELIELHEGVPISTIFKNKGEQYFRNLEKKITLNELKKQKLVIALGGGAFLQNSIRNQIKISGVSFWLDVNLDVILSRLINSKKRPLLFKKNLNDTVKKIYLERKNIYNLADYRIKCKSLKPEVITNKIKSLYEKL